MMNSVGYIDAGTGSYLLAAIASGAAGSWFFLRSQVAKFRGGNKNSAVSDQVASPSSIDS